MVKHLWIVPVGGLAVRPDVLTPGAPGDALITVPVYVYLVDTGSGLVLLDTGCSRTLHESPRSILGDAAEAMAPRMGPDSHVVRALAQLGIHPEDVSLVANSHLHFDHAGANTEFPAAEFWIQQAEWEALTADPGSYPDPGAKPLGPVKLLHGDTAVAPGLTLISTPGHTPGHQSLLVQGRDGLPILITSDAVYTRAHFDPEHLGAAHDRLQARRSVARLLEFAQRDGARPFFSHDPAQADEEQWVLAPKACW